MRQLKRERTISADIPEDGDELLEPKKLPVDKEEETLVGSFTKLDVKPEIGTGEQQANTSSSQS